MNHPEKILVIRFSSLGDIVLTTPVVKSLNQKFPESKIFFLTKSQYRDLLKNDPNIFSLIKFDPVEKHKGVLGFLRLVKELKTFNFDLMVDLHTNLRSFFIRHLLKTRIKIKYDKRWLTRFLLVHFKFFKVKPTHTVDSYLKALKKIDVNSSEKDPKIFLDQKSENFSKDFFIEKKIEKDDIVVGIHPGARWETKRWSEEKFAKVCQILSQKAKLKIILLGDQKDQEVIERINSHTEDQKLFKAVDLPLNKFMSLIKRCDGFITNDSGPMHIASALGVPVVAIFGPTHPRLGFSPMGSENMVLTANVKCSPCSLHGEKKCYKKSRFCMDLIEPEMVTDAVERILKKKFSLKKGT
ncbi:MAG: lipopolysaccharide heptosyltransferase II [candidate division Zixibacteria bacterium]|nr:lipopolysaccharide heptosyltransferase II [candidate division Zixibacteria bacterium]